MPQTTRRFRFYRGQPVKRMRQGREGIILTMVSPVKDQPGTQLKITQADWDNYGEWREVLSTHMDAMRELAR